MLIGGFQPCTFSDFPGKLAAIIFTQGCNLRCGYCHNPDLVVASQPPSHQPTAVLDLLAQRRGRLGGVVITGGEPTLHPNLPHFIAAIRDLGLAIKLDTNGSRPHALAALLADELLDYIALDVKHLPNRYETLFGPCSAHSITSSIDLTRHCGVPHEFRTTVVAALHDGPSLMQLADHLVGGQHWFLQRVKRGRQLDPALPLEPPEEQVLAAVVTHATRNGLPCSIR